MPNAELKIKKIPVTLSVSPYNGKKTEDHETLEPISKNVVSINGTKQCELYYPDDEAACAEINTQIGIISGSLRIWFENYYMKYSQWGWNNQGQLLENRIPGAQEIIDPNSRLNVKITPNSITLPSTRIVEDDPNRAEFDDCPNTINSTNVNEPCATQTADGTAWTDCCVKDSKESESKCLVNHIESFGGSKIKNIRKTNKKLKPQKRKTKRTNPRKTKQRKLPKQKISKKRNKM
jgi:hypothetical protein